MTHALAKVISGSTLGVEAFLVRVEVDLARGLPGMTVVGLPESAVREGRERVSAALHNSGYRLPPRRITVNLAPADVPKRGSAFDLPIAVGLLAGMGEVPPEPLDGICVVGELGLDGELRPVAGALPLALCCAGAGVRGVILPRENAREASAVEGVRVFGAGSLPEVVAHLRGDTPMDAAPPEEWSAREDGEGGLDLADVRGQGFAKRALEIAAAGAHNIILVGPPGAGKSMLARRLPGILPPLTRRESIDVTRIHSVAGRVRPGGGLMRARPFRVPHHTISEAGLIGGGSVPRPGEVSLAHHGVLFLDELPEFTRGVLEALRQPLEEHEVHIGRARVSVSYPARVTLAAAMNPCPCGFHGDGLERCTCHFGEVRRYLSRVSGPLLDRIDLHVEVPRVEAALHDLRAPGESSAEVRERVLLARERQLRRFAASPSTFANGHMEVREVAHHCALGAEAKRRLREATIALGFSARGYHRVLKVARTIADLDGSGAILPSHVIEAVQYRSVDRRELARA